MKKVKKETAQVAKYQIDGNDGEVVHKAVVRNWMWPGRSREMEDMVKRIRMEFRAEYTRQGNFTICVLISDDNVVPGVAKRCPTDAENTAVGEKVALSNAVKNWLVLVGA